MRLHRIEVEAFGPFVTRQDVDFDALAGGGLFLVHGATGSGKTSLLDAVCFALFADVPGDRQARGLRSDLADPDTPARVLLEFTASGRRLRIERHGEFLRPKRRGTGTVPQQSRVRLDERASGSWRVLSTRIDEAAEVVRDQLGMGLAQFRRVALLPQGDFAAFLKATPEDRRSLLEKLFDVSRFTDVESWLAEQRRSLSQELVRRQTEFDTQVERLRDLLAGTAPESIDLSVVPGWEQGPMGVCLAQWPSACAALTEVAEVATTRAMEAQGRAEAAERQTRDVQSAAEAAAAVRSRGLAARVLLTDLASSAADVERTRVRLAEAARAGVASGELRGVIAAQRRLDAAAGDAETALAGLIGAGDLDRLTTTLGVQAGILADTRRRVTEAEGLAAERRAWATRVSDLDRDLCATTVELAGLRSQIADAAEALSALVAVAGELTQREHRHTRAVEALRLFREERRVRAELVAALGEETRRHEASVLAREALVTLEAARLTDLAAELAGHLRDGDPCPVCGAVEHPDRQLRRTDWSPDARADAAAQVDARGTELGRVRERIAALETRVRMLHADLDRAVEPSESAAGAAEEDLASLLSEAVTHLGEARSAAAALPRRRAALAALETRLAARAEEHAVLRAEHAAAEAVSARLRDAFAEALDQARTLLATHEGNCPCASAPPVNRGADTGVPGRSGGRQAGLVPSGVATTDTSAAGPEERRDAGQPAEVTPLDDSLRALRSLAADADGRHEALARRAGVALGARARVAEAERTGELADAAFAEALHASGFSDRASLEAALIPDAERARLAQSIRRHDEALAVAEAALADPAVIEALADPEPVVVDVAREAHEQARATHLAATRVSVEVTRLATELSATLARIVERAEPLARLQARHAEVGELADLVAGTSINNLRKMRLSAFVLAARLERVVALANERLALMDQGRFRLEHDPGRAARGARSGLGLIVHDEWTGMTRPPASLSGGESFMASLALALGLADAIRESSGGQEIQTLFVDEGFGSLDEDSLEHVMTVLDGLRDGGRAVGVVSHLGDLRDRIPARLEVVKSPQGSHVRAALPA